MTRLTTEWISHIVTGMEEYDRVLKSKTGIGLAELSARCAGMDPADFAAAAAGRRVACIPITQGEGIIGSFSESVASIVSALGAEAFVTRATDVDGIWEAREAGADVLFFADDIVRDGDILFLDVSMPGTNGIETARKLRELGYEGELIFLSASREAVFYAFDVRANNYLLKEQLSEERIEEVFLKAAREVQEKQSEYLLLTGVGEHRNVPVQAIQYFEINQKIVTVHYSGTTFEFVSTMGKLENLMFNRGFVRISRSILVATRYIQSFVYEQVTLRSGETLPVGRKYYKPLKEAMAGRNE